jgi:serine/threonine protein kinase
MKVFFIAEYGLSGIVSTKGDVYSYGILLLEMLTRKQPTNDMFGGDLNLHNWVDRAFPNKVKEVIDNSLFSEIDGDEFEENNIYKSLLSLLHVGLLCSKYLPEERPTMRVVVRMLESIREDLEANVVVSRGWRRSISNLLSNTNATRNYAPASNEQSSSTF